MKVLIKYCGGCNPTYDRVALVKEIITRLKADYSDLQVVYEGEADFGIMITGCDAYCIDRDENKQGVPYWIVVGPNTVDYFTVPHQIIPLKVLDLIKSKMQ